MSRAIASFAGLGALLALLGTALGACGNPPGAGRADEPLFVEGFCEAWTEAVCEPARACGCLPPGTGAAACAEAVADACPLSDGSRLRGELARGQLVYDPIAAADYVERVRGASCDMGGYLDDATLGRLDTLFGTVDGTREIGEPCTPGAIPDACREGLCDPERGTCFALVGEGERCDESHACDPAATGGGLTLQCSDAQVCEQVAMEPAPPRPPPAHDGTAPVCDLIR